MRKWSVLFEKEMLEMVRNAKWLWVPVVFLILGIMQPVTVYYTPQILKSMGGLSDEAIAAMPAAAAPDVLIKTLSQFGTLGLLILVLAMMGTVASELTSGAAAMVLMKPVRHASFVTAKWAAALTLTIVSLFLGYLGSWYYTGQLIGHVAFGRFLGSFAVYGWWFAFIITVTVLAGCLLRGTGAIAFLSLVVAAVLSIATGLLDKWMRWSPSRMSAHAGEIVSHGNTASGFALSLIVTLLAIFGLLVAAVYAFKQKDLLQ
jgi:ABC-2 type transport system permease protein